MMRISILALLIINAGRGRAEIKNGVLNSIDEEPAPPKHHKVHDLIFHPDQHSWCELKKIRQILTHANCESKEMENFVCVGTCFSYSVPQTIPTIPGDEMLDYCDSCQPEESHWTTVALDCKEDGSIYKVTKSVQLITNCSCAACKPTRKAQLTNDVTQNEHRISDLIYKMLPDNLPVPDGKTAQDHRKYSQMSLKDLKKVLSLDSAQEQKLNGKKLMKDTSSFNEDEETDPLKSLLSN